VVGIQSFDHVSAYRLFLIVQEGARFRLLRRIAGACGVRVVQGP
jgi:hypothetical protein